MRGNKLYIIFRLSYGVKSIGTTPVSTASIYRYQLWPVTLRYNQVPYSKIRNKMVRSEIFGEFDSRNSLQNPWESVKFRQIVKLVHFARVVTSIFVAWTLSTRSELRFNLYGTGVLFVAGKNKRFYLFLQGRERSFCLSGLDFVVRKQNLRKNYL